MRVLIIEDEELASRKTRRDAFKIDPSLEIVAKLGSIKEQ